MDLYYSSPIYKELRALDVNKDFGEGCTNCEVKHFCGGGCRGTAFNSSRNIKSSPPNCQEKKKTIYSYLWEFVEKGSLYDSLRKV